MKTVKWIVYLIIGAFLAVMLLVVVTDDENQCVGGGVMNSTVPSGSFAMPEQMPPGRLTSPFGPRWGTMHNGVDIATGPGAPIYAFADGIVSQSGPASGFGQWIVIDHNIDGKHFATVYGHLFPEDLLVKTGEQVRAGQQIAREGYNGQVVPSGPGGSHLHFEVRDGGLAGTPVDPQPWLDKAVNPTAGGERTESVDAPTVGLSPGKPLPPLPSSVGSEVNQQRDAIKVMRAVHQAFPNVVTIGGWRPYDPFPDHPSGRGIDVMIPAYSSTAGQDFGTQIKDWLYANRGELNIDYMIWQQTYIPSNGTGNVMEDRGSPTQNHFDHIHITVRGDGFPSGNETYAMETINAGGGSYTSTNGCATGPLAGNLANGTVPAELEPWLKRAGSLCAGVSPALLAAQMQQESHFTPHLVSTSGARGYAQFMPGTWASIGAEVDDNGKVIGQPGSGDPNDPADAAMAQGRYMCQLREQMEGELATGRVSGDITELTLAAYNAGPGNVQTYAGVPPFTETTAYVKAITNNIANFTSIG